MSKTNKRKNAKQEGIALPEIMLIISLVIILAMLSYPKYYDAMTKAGRDSALVSSDAMLKALKMYKLDKRDYPHSDLTALVIADYTNTTSLVKSFSSLTVQVKDSGGNSLGGACIHGIADRVEGEYHIANCSDINGLNPGGYCCWKNISGDCTIDTSAPYFISTKGWYECKSKL